MKIFLITQEAQLYLPELVTDLLRRRRQDLCAATVLPPYAHTTRRIFLTQLKDLYGPADFLRLAGLIACRRVQDILGEAIGRSPRASIKRILASANVPLWRTGSINEPSYVERVRQKAPDVILSLSSPQIFQDALLAVPKLGCLNYHSGLLPRHRGLLAPFWALAESVPQTGVTVHLMTPKIDHGPIVAQRTFEVRSDDTLHSLCQRSISVGMEVLHDALERMQTGRYDPSVIPDSSMGSYRGFPTAADAQKFRLAGRKFF